MAPDAAWVFHGANAQFTSALFTSRCKAEEWVEENEMSGMLTTYPLNISIYDWAVQAGIWQPSKSHHHNLEFKQRFTSAALEHVPSEDGHNC
jgi:hypothetical protein